MCQPALDEENRTATTQYNVNTYQKHWAIPGKNPSQTGDRGIGDMEFPRVLKNMEIPGVN